MLFGETVAVYCENHTEHTNTLPNNIWEFSLYLTGNALHLHNKDQPVIAVWETVNVYCENHTKHTNTPLGQNAEY
jgi:hypothetical protein